MIESSAQQASASGDSPAMTSWPLVDDDVSKAEPAEFPGVMLMYDWMLLVLSGRKNGTISITIT